MSDMVERIARAMYLDRVNPDVGPITLSVASMGWDDLPEDHSPGRQVWHCKSFWRRASRASLKAIRELPEEPGPRYSAGEYSRRNQEAMVDDALAEES